MKGRCSYTDALVIVSAMNERQVEAIVGSISESLKEEHALQPMSHDKSGGWGLLDYGDLVVHVFMEESRDHYDLDRLWSEAPRISTPNLTASAIVGRGFDAASMADRRRRFM